MGNKSLIETLIKNDKDAKIINELIEKEIIKKEEVVNFVIESNNFDMIYYVAKYVNNVDVHKLEEKVLQLDCAKDIFTFAYNIEGINVSKFEDKIIELNDPQYIYKFAEYMQNKGANIRRLENEIVNIGNSKYVYWFAKYISGANLKKLEDKIVELGNEIYICDFAAEIKDADVDRLSDVVIETNEYHWIIYFAIKNKSYVDKMLDAVIENENYEGINFALSFFGDTHLHKFVDVVAKCSNSNYIYDFVEKYNSKLDKLEIDKLACSVIKNSFEEKDMYCVELFIVNINNAPIDRLKSALNNYINGVYYDDYEEKKNLKVKRKIFKKR